LRLKLPFVGSAGEANVITGFVEESQLWQQQHLRGVLHCGDVDDRRTSAPVRAEGSIGCGRYCQIVGVNHS
jgi:hypothetical protein